jgi:hypothetical protein
MARERSCSPIRWKNATPADFYDHRKWKDIVPSLIENPEAFHGGMPRGSVDIWISRRKIQGYRFRIQNKTLPGSRVISKVFNKTKFNSMEAAHEAGLAFQRQFSTERNLIQNQWRLIAPNIVEMILTNEQTTIFDYVDLEKVLSTTWYAMNCELPHRAPIWYARRGQAKQPLSNLIYGDHELDVIDHINGVSLDNRRCNLISATWESNARNHCIRSTNTSGKNGVHPVNSKGCLYFVASWKENNKEVHAKHHRYFPDDEASKQRAFELASYDRDQADIRLGIIPVCRPKRST